METPPPETPVSEPPPRPRPADRVRAAGRRALLALGRLARAIRGRRWLLVGLLALALAAPPGLFAAWAWWTVARLDLGRVQEVSYIYAAGQVLAPGLSVRATDLAGTLRRLRYEERTGAPQRPGQFRRDEGAWELFLRARDDPAGPRPPQRLRLELDGERIAALYDPAAGTRLERAELEPELLSGLGDTPGQLRRPVRLAAIPPHLTAAILAAEDHRFFEHRGVDVTAVLRALWVNLRRGEVAQGGSTLTQQLVKNLVLSPRRTLDRKLREAALAVMLEGRYAKAEILEAYVNAIYLGQHGAFAVYGFGAAAGSYFGKDVERLSLAEAALLAGMIRAPNTYSPVQNLERARERRNQVLRRMRDLSQIDAKAYAAAVREPVRVRRGAPPRLLGPYFLDHVRAQIEEPREEGGHAAGLRIYTTLDPVLQRAAEAALARGLDQLEGRHPPLRRRDPARRLQGALVALDPATGEIRALAGGRDYAQSQFNRVTHARRQPGSAFKPFVFLAALRFGPAGELPRFTPVSPVADEPLTLRVGRQEWSPRNYEDRFEGTVSVRRALEQSLNAATVRIGMEVGLPAVIRTAREVGFTSPMAPVPALTLGSFEVTPLELAAGYAVLASGGERVPVTAVRAVLDREGARLDEPPDAQAAAVRAGEAFLLTHLLHGVVERGTGATVRALGVEGPVAGKTGTTNDGRDAWFVGYTSRLVALVWVGFDEGDVLRLSGAQAALPIWADFMRTATAVLPAEPFPAPPSVVFRDVDPTNGKLATFFCPVVVREVFLASTEPLEVCPDHGQPGQLFDSLFRRFLDLLR